MNKLNELKFAARVLLKGKGYSAVIIATLAIGIGASTAIFTFVNSVLFRPLQFIIDPVKARKMNKYILILILVSGSHGLFAQGEEELSPWQLLSNVSYRQVYDEDQKGLTSVPQFSKELKAKDGNEISILGYYLPFEMPKKNQMVISFYPYASCFFCGGGGPETVVEVELKEPIPDLEMDELVRVKGRLKLNEDDWSRLIFIVEEATIIERI